METNPNRSVFSAGRGEPSAVNTKEKVQMKLLLLLLVLLQLPLLLRLLHR